MIRVQLIHAGQLSIDYRAVPSSSFSPSISLARFPAQICLGVPSSWMYHKPSLLISIGRSSPLPSSLRRPACGFSAMLREIIVVRLRGMDPRSSSDGSRIGDVPGKPCAESPSARLVEPTSKAEVREANEARLLRISECRQDSAEHAHTSDLRLTC
jgi:hypothetical protein